MVCLKDVPVGSCLAKDEYVKNVSQSSCLSVAHLMPTSFYSHRFVVGDFPSRSAKPSFGGRGVIAKNGALLGKTLHTGKEPGP